MRVAVAALGGAIGVVERVAVAITVVREAVATGDTDDVVRVAAAVDAAVGAAVGAVLAGAFVADCPPHAAAKNGTTSNWANLRRFIRAAPPFLSASKAAITPFALTFAGFEPPSRS